MTKTLRRLLPALAALALLASADLAGAQDRQLLGARVRITAPAVLPGKFTGTVTQYDAAHLAVRDSMGAEQSFPLRSILFLELSKGAGGGGSVGSRAKLLAFALGGVGAIVGGVAHPYKDVGPSVALGAGAGIVLGAGLGAAWGASAPHERWEWVVRPFGYDSRAPAPPAVPADSTAPPPPAPTPQP
jgi:hypothetical protein